MSLAELENVVPLSHTETGGADFHEFDYKVQTFCTTPGPVNMRKMLHLVFGIRSLADVVHITCWSDSLRDWGEKDSYQHLEGVLMIGVFYKMVNNQECISHFFVRTLEDYWGPLDKWKEDIKFPEGVRKYSVCAVLPRDYQLSDKGMRDPHNHAVTTYSWEQLTDMGIDIQAIKEFAQNG